MATAFRNFTDLEQKTHDQLYQNIVLLTYKYPTTKEFKEVFGQDMFMKNNKAAFHHVVYYLLNILDPATIKEKVTAWPPYDVKMENKFRAEVLQYINELNIVYKDFNIPHIMASHLISPGGYRFVKFMLKLSELVLVQHLKKIYPQDLLSAIKPHKIPERTKQNIKTLQNLTAVIEHNRLKEKLNNFNLFLNNSKLKADEILYKQTQLNKDLAEVNKIFKAKTNIFDQENFTAIIHSIKDKCQKLKDSCQSLKNIEQLSLNCIKLMGDLLSQDAVLELKRTDIDIPNEIKHLIVFENEEVDLHELINGLVHLIERKNLDMMYFTRADINKLIEMYTELCDKYTELDKKLFMKRDDLGNVVEIFRNNFNSSATMQK